MTAPRFNGPPNRPGPVPAGDDRHRLVQLLGRLLAETWLARPTGSRNATGARPQP